LLKIITKQQKIGGKVWSAAHGFSPKDFSYTSGLINSGTSFRQKYGVFSAKIKLGDPMARNAFWLLADKVTPHIDVCRTGNGKVWFDLFSGDDKSVKTKLGSRYSKDYFIFTLEWTADKLVWRINGVDVQQQTNNVPQEPMYVNLAGGVNTPLNGMTTMDIDWIRVYQIKN
jgi:beta-glucanase (GH16 family)